MFVVLDIGNSRIKYYFNNKVITTLNEFIAEFTKYCENNPNELYSLSIGLNIYVYSTVPYKTEKYSSELKFACMEVISKFKDVKFKEVQIINQYHYPINNSYPSMGQDRLVKLSALSLVYPQQDLALFDFGTATTLNLLDSKKNIVGGLIYPGFYTGIKALINNAAAIPDISFRKMKAFYLDYMPDGDWEIYRQKGYSDTDIAILEGNYWACHGLISSWIDYAKRILPDVKLIACGGAAFYGGLFDDTVADHELAMKIPEFAG